MSARPGRRSAIYWFALAGTYDYQAVLVPAYLRSFAGVSYRRLPMPDKNTPLSGFQFGLTNLKPVESSKVALTFPDGAKREFPKNITGFDIARGISPSLAKRTVAMALDGVVR